jgi:hypothetical protein
MALRRRAAVPEEEHREVAAADVLDWSRGDSPLIRVRIARDTVPGGLSLAMAPMFVGWRGISSGFGPDDHYLIHNVNIANNPVGGVLVLGTLKVWADSVEKVEFVAVTTKVKNHDTPFGHAMLRFIFREGRRPVILDKRGSQLANDAEVSDLIVSWEAWRPPQEKFDAVKGLNPNRYALTPRCMIGAVRYLTDSTLNRPWHCYTIKLPDIEHAYDELMYSCLALADAVARQTVSQLLERRIDDGKNFPHDYLAASEGDWAAVAEYYTTSRLSRDPVRDVLDGKISYHLLERSCISMALLSLDWANHRIHRRAGLPEPARVAVAPESLPSFITDLAGGERTPMLLRVPAALQWIMVNQTVVVEKAAQMLDDVGLLQRDEKGPLRTDWETPRETPYGNLLDHMIY